MSQPKLLNLNELVAVEAAGLMDLEYDYEHMLFGSNLLDGYHCSGTARQVVYMVLQWSAAAQLCRAQSNSFNSYELVLSSVHLRNFLYMLHIHFLTKDLM